MKAETAKNNPVIRTQAIKFYLLAERKKGEVFTFMSLFSDAEPYPVDELIEVQQKHVNQLFHCVETGNNPPNELNARMGDFNRLNLINQVKSEQLTLKQLIAKYGSKR